MKKTTLFLVAFAMICGLCGAGESTPDETKPEEACFRVRDVRGFTAMDDRFVSVECVRKRHYLLTMANPCFGLENSIGIKVANQFDRVCSNDGAWITYKDFNQTKRCTILTVESVTGLDQAKKVVGERKAAGAEEKAADSE